MKALVIGGSSFVGKRLVQALLAQGTSVTVISRTAMPDASIRHIQCDRRDATALAAATNGQHWDAIYDHCCMTGDEARAAVDILRDKTGHYVLTSSMCVYGWGTGLAETAFDPLSDAEPGGWQNAYTIGKRDAERAIARSGMTHTLVRLPIMLGPDDPEHRIEWHAERIAVGQPITANASRRLSYTTAQHGADSLASLTHMGGMGAINISAETSLTLGEFIRTIEAAVERTAVLSAGEKSPFDTPGDQAIDSGRAALSKLPQLDRATLLSEIGSVAATSKKTR